MKSLGLGLEKVLFTSETVRKKASLPAVEGCWLETERDGQEVRQ